MCCGLWSVISALFLVADMVSDGLNVWDYHSKAYDNNEHRTNFLSDAFYRNYNRTTGKRTEVQESYYFITSFAAMLLPVAVATICLLFYLLYVYFMEIRQFFISRCCSAECGMVFGTIASSLMAPLTFILCVILSIVVIFLSWIVSPILHIFFAFFIAFGNNPAGKNESKLKSLTWKRFATLMMFLSIVETLFEAVPEAILGLCLSYYQLNHSSIEDNESRFLFLWKAFPYQVISLFFSFFTVVKTIGTVAYTTTNDWDNSIFGMVNFLRNQYKVKCQKEKGKKGSKKEKKEEIERLNDEIKHLENLNDAKQKTIEIYNRFNTNLEISGFETGNEMKRGRFLKDMGLPSELLFDEEKASYPDNSCVLTDLGLPESLRFMTTLNGTKYNDSALEFKCSIYMVESKSSSPSKDSSATALPSREELLDVEKAPLLNGEEPKKGKNRFAFWKKNSKTISQLDHSDIEMQNKNKEVQNVEETSDTPPPSHPSTPTLLPEHDSQISRPGSTQEIEPSIKEETNKEEDIV